MTLKWLVNGMVCYWVYHIILPESPAKIGNIYSKSSDKNGIPNQIINPQLLLNVFSLHRNLGNRDQIHSMLHQ
jgi:hypothetical protein